MHRFTEKLKSACKSMGLCLARPINAISGFAVSAQRHDKPEYGLGLLDEEETPQVFFRMGPFPAELNDDKHFFDRRVGSWNAPSAFK
jgi:hypothetical protein